MPGNPDTTVTPASPAVPVEPRAVITEQPGTTPPPPTGRLRAMRVACCPDVANIACDRLSNDKLAMHMGFGAGYAMGLIGTVAGAMCGVFVTPPLYFMGAVPFALTSALAATHIGCYVNQYCKTVEDINNVTGPVNDETYLVVPDDLLTQIEQIDTPITEEPYADLPEDKEELSKDTRFDEVYEVAQWVREVAQPQEISTSEMPGDREGLIIDHNPEAARKHSFSTHNDYLVIDNS